MPHSLSITVVPSVVTNFFFHLLFHLIFLLGYNLPAMQETLVQFLGREDPLEKGKATHFSILAWRVPWTAQSMGSQRVGHD